MSYEQTVKIWRDDPDAFWSAAASGLVWERRWDKVLDTSAHPAGRWFPGARINTCYNALDRHIDNGSGTRAALIYHSAMTGARVEYSYSALRDRVARVAGALQRNGLARGDRAVIYMPMVPEAVIAMLACARIGAVHSVVFGGFAADELAARIDDAKPRIIISASAGLEPGRVVAYKPLLDRALQIAAHKPDLTVILQRSELEADLSPKGEVNWTDFESSGMPVDCVPVAATDPLYILYTSGTTGRPKGVVRDNGGHAVALHWSMKSLYDIGPGDVFWAASDIGWVVGHSYIVYGPLLSGATTVLYEGKPVGTPDAAAFWRVVAEHKVKVMFTAPTAIRAIKREDPDLTMASQHDLSSLRALFLAGERCDPDTLEWSGRMLGVPVIDHWWQTETGWAIAGNLLGEGLFEVKPGSAGKQMPGWQVEVVDDAGEPLPAGSIGTISCALPLGPGALTTLWGADQRFHDAYFSALPGRYSTGDAGYVDEEGYIFVMTRIDDVINVAGHRLSTGAIEEVIATHPDVAECAVTGVHDPIKGQAPFGFLCLNSGDLQRSTEELVAEVVALVRQRIGPVASFKQAVVVQRLPKTRSGKILRGILRRIVDGESYELPATIDDPLILEEIRAAVEGRP